MAGGIVYRLFVAIFLVFSVTSAMADVATSGWVNAVVSAHTADTNNPHSVNAAQVGLSNVKNIDTTNAENITSGTLDTSRLSVGTTAGTVAAGDDVRFYALPTARPSVEIPDGMVLMWFEE